MNPKVLEKATPCQETSNLPIAPPRVDSSKGPPRKISKILAFFAFFRPTQKMGPGGAKWGQEDFFLLIQTVPIFWAERILILRIFIFWIFWAPNLGPAWARPWAQLGPDLGPGLGPGLGPHTWAQTWAQACAQAWAQTPPVPDEFSDPNLTPPRDQIRRKDPCCDCSTWFHLGKKTNIIS